MAMAMAGGANTNSTICTVPARFPQNGPSPRVQYTKAPPARGMAQASSA